MSAQGISVPTIEQLKSLKPGQKMTYYRGNLDQDIRETEKGIAEIESKQDKEPEDRKLLPGLRLYLARLLLIEETAKSLEAQRKIFVSRIPLYPGTRNANPPCSYIATAR